VKGPLSRSLLILFALFCAGCLVGAVVAKLANWDAGMLGPFAGFVTVILAAAALTARIAEQSSVRQALLALLLLCCVGTIAEWLGLYHGIFGAYHYTRIWWPSLELPGATLFPVGLPLTWFIILAAVCLSVPARWPVAWAVIGGAILATFLDVALEPVIAWPVRLWQWENPEGLLKAPTQNFLTWFLVSLVGLAVIQPLRLARDAAFGRWIIFAILAGATVIGVLFFQLGSIILAPVGLLLLWLLKQADCMQVSGRA
jgi:uncharacterized membrane protein